MSERAWAEKAPIRDVVLAAILRGLDGYPDDDTTRPAEVLAALDGVYVKAGLDSLRPEELGGITVADLRGRAQAAFGRIDLQPAVRAS